MIHVKIIRKIQTLNEVIPLLFTFHEAKSSFFTLRRKMQICQKCPFFRKLTFQTQENHFVGNLENKSGKVSGTN